MKNRRKFERVQALAELLIRPVRSKVWTRAVLYNISEGGIGIYAPGPLRKNQRLLIKTIYFKDHKTSPMAVDNASGKVVWTHKMGEYMAAGIMFTGVGAE